jgi:hypothetical protein
MLTVLGFVPLALLLYGFSQRRERRVHVVAMSAAIAADIGMVVTVAVQRQVASRLAHGAIDLLLGVHIALATASLLMYAVAIVTGIRLWRGRGGRRIHRANGLGLVAVRIMVSTTSVMVAVR